MGKEDINVIHIIVNTFNNLILSGSANKKGEANAGWINEYLAVCLNYTGGRFQRSQLFMAKLSL